jgi:flavodoxin
MKALVVYYSLTGKTRTVATALAGELGADIEEIHCKRYAPGFSGFLRAGYDSWRGNLPAIEPLSHAASGYDVVAIGGPVWAWHPSTPVRTYLQQEGPRLPRIAFFLTHGGSASRRSLAEMERLVGKKPVATLVVREAEVRSGSFAFRVSSFATTLSNSAMA